MIALSHEVDGLYVAFEGGDPLVDCDGNRYELGNIGLFNANEEDIVALVVEGRKVFAEISNGNRVLVFDHLAVTDEFKSWARGVI